MMQKGYKLKIIYTVLFSAIILAVAAQMPTSTDELEKYLLEALKNNDTLDFEFENYTNKPCEPLLSEKPDFTKLQDRRISEAKCQEYIWEMQTREEEEKLNEQCRIYLISQIKRGVIPEIFFVINSPVIFGGVPAKRAEFPHMGAIGWPAKDQAKKWIFKCGSTLISDQFLLTAAHCSQLSMRASDVSSYIPEVVVLGLNNIEEDQFNIHGNAIVKKIKRIILHPYFRPPRRYNDIALIELEEKVKFDHNVQPACLWGINDLHHAGNVANLTGWGYTEKKTPSSQLQVAQVNLLDNSDCDKILSKYRNRNWQGFTYNQMCAGNLDGGVDTCQGDSGGPLQVNIPVNTEGKIHKVIGVTSFGIKCGLKNRPGVYSRVSSYINWIEMIVWGSEMPE